MSTAVKTTPKRRKQTAKSASSVKKVKRKKTKKVSKSPTSLRVIPASSNWSSARNQLIKQVSDTTGSFAKTVSDGSGFIVKELAAPYKKLDRKGWVRSSLWFLFKLYSVMLIFMTCLYLAKPMFSPSITSYPELAWFSESFTVLWVAYWGLIVTLVVANRDEF